MPELWEIVPTAKLRAFGPPDALDGLKVPAACAPGASRRDEVLWVGEPGRTGELLEALQSQLAQLGNRAAVVDHSDGYALFALTGDEREELFARLSSIRIPGAGGFVQGNFAGVPATGRRCTLRRNGSRSVSILAPRNRRVPRTTRHRY